MKTTTHVTAYISEETRDAIEAYVKRRGVKNAYLIEEALQHPLQALREIPEDLMISSRLVLTGEAMAAIAERVIQEEQPTESLKGLFREQGDAGSAGQATDPRDDRSRYRSGNIDLDRFFLRYAGQNQFRHHIGTTYVAVHDEHVTGFVTVSSGRAEPNENREAESEIDRHPAAQADLRRSVRLGR